MKTHNDSGGFTLVEILVAIAVSGVIVLILGQVTTSYLHVSQTGRYLNLANSYIEAKVEALRNKGFNSLTNGTTSLTTELPAQLPPSRAANMVVTNPIDGIKQVVLTVSYKDQGQVREYKYTTYVGELGVVQ